MKKVLLIVLMIAGAYQLKAQQWQPKPLDSALIRSPQLFQNFKPNDTSVFKKYFNRPQAQSLAQLNALLKPGNTELFASRMPVVKLHSDDRMPVAKVHSNDRMPVLKVKVVAPLMKQQLVTP